MYNMIITHFLYKFFVALRLYCCEAFLYLIIIMTVLYTIKFVYINMECMHGDDYI